MEQPPARLRLRLRLPEPYDLGWVLGFLADRAAPSLERVERTGLVRVVRIDDLPAVVMVRPGPGEVAPRWLDVEAAPASLAGPGACGIAAAALRRLVRRMLDLDTDLAPFLALARRDPLLAPLVARHPGLRLPQLPDPFEGAVRAIIGQQVSVAAARTLVDRLVRLLGEPVAGSGTATGADGGDTRAGSGPGIGAGLFAFPRPATLAAAAPERLGALGMPRAKAATLIAVAAATRDGVLAWERLRAGPPDAAQAALVALPGVGPWTASYVRMRALGDRDAFPASDLGVVKALARLAAPRDIGALAERWRPFRAYAAIHLWRSLSP
jgi:AraC family transcriptional regulator, regulatory protein of adaptative response / DNA-3-methyladenine glycosylase II